MKNSVNSQLIDVEVPGQGEDLIDGRAMRDARKSSCKYQIGEYSLPGN